MKFFGRSLQILGLGLLPLSMVIELTGGGGESFGTRDMLVMMVFGVSAFYVGRILEGHARA